MNIIVGVGSKSNKFRAPLKIVKKKNTVPENKSVDKKEFKHVSK